MAGTSVMVNSRPPIGSIATTPEPATVYLREYNKGRKVRDEELTSAEVAAIKYILDRPPAQKKRLFKRNDVRNDPDFTHICGSMAPNNASKRFRFALTCRLGCCAPSSFLPMSSALRRSQLLCMVGDAGRKAW
jgi:hypothetical protein